MAFPLYSLQDACLIFIKLPKLLVIMMWLAMQEAMRAAEKKSTEECPVKMKLVAPPLYVLTTNVSFIPLHLFAVLKAAVGHLYALIYLGMACSLPRVPQRCWLIGLLIDMLASIDARSGLSMQQCLSGLQSLNFHCRPWRRQRGLRC